MRTLGLILTLMLMWATSHAHAAVSVASDKNPNIFKANSKVVTPIEAEQLAKDHDIQKCTPIKGATDASGNETPAYRCKAVKLEYNAKTGMPHWVNL